MWVAVTTHYLISVSCTGDATSDSSWSESVVVSILAGAVNEGISSKSVLSSSILGQISYFNPPVLIVD